MKTKKLTELTMLAAIVVVLTIFSTFIKFGPFSITLALVPIIIGGVLYGAEGGALLGFVFSLVVLITGLFGWDGGTVMMLIGIRPLAAILICLLKGTLAGWVAALVYRAVAKKNGKLAVVLASIVCPVVNTGVFIAGMLLFFTSTLESWASGQGVFYFIIFGLTGINFVVELLSTLALSSVVTAIIKYRKKSA